MASFPGFGKKEPEKKKNPWGDENPYRIFGVTDDAPYEEVELAYKALVEENKENEKYCIQLEMMKEKIFDDRWGPSPSLFPLSLPLYCSNRPSRDGVCACPSVSVRSVQSAML